MTIRKDDRTPVMLGAFLKIIMDMCVWKTFNQGVKCSCDDLNDSSCSSTTDTTKSNLIICSEEGIKLCDLFLHEFLHFVISEFWIF